MQSRRVDSFVGRQVRVELPQRFAKLSGGATRIAALPVIQADSAMNQRLQKNTSRAVLPGPGFLQHFMALEELPLIEKLNSSFDYGRSSNLPTPSSYFSFSANASLILSSGRLCVTSGANNFGCWRSSSRPRWLSWLERRTLKIATSLLRNW